MSQPSIPPFDEFTTEGLRRRDFSEWRGSISVLYEVTYEVTPTAEKGLLLAGLGALGTLRRRGR